jgi:hypothetical protein
VASIEKAISQTSKAFIDFQERILASGVLNQAPELSHSLQSTVETLSVATAIITNRDSYCADFEHDSDQECTSGRMSDRIEDHLTGVDHDHVNPQDRSIGLDDTPRDMTGHGSIGQYIEHVRRSQESPRSALYSDEPQAILYSRSHHDLMHAAARGAARTSSLRVHDDETNQDHMGDWTARLPAESISAITAGTASALEKNDATAQRPIDNTVRDREGVLVSNSQRILRISSSLTTNIF